MTTRAGSKRKGQEAGGICLGGSAGRWQHPGDSSTWRLFIHGPASQRSTLGFSFGGGGAVPGRTIVQGQEKSVYGLSVCTVPPQGPSPSAGLCEVGTSILDEL